MALSRQNSLYLILLAIWLAVVFAFGGLAIVNEFRKPLNNKDYPIWYEAGQAAVHGEDIYAIHRGTEMNFTYPPFGATCVYGPLSLLGNYAFVIGLVLLQTLAWGASILMSVRLATGQWWRQHPLLYLLPALVTVGGVWTSYQLGQVNLMLLPLMLGGFLLLNKTQGWWRLAAGGLFAAATAFKAFPLLVVGYLLWRRHGLACIGFALGLVLMLLVLPGLIRGFDTAWQDMHTWTTQVLLTSDEQHIGQRNAAWAYSRENQSLQATVVRLTHAMPYWHDGDQPRYVNVFSLDFAVARALAGVVALGLVGVLLWTMPGYRRRTPQTDSIEQAMVMCLITIGSPLTWGYYLVWLLFPLTVLLHHIGELPEGSPGRLRWVVLWFVVALLPLLAVNVPVLRELHAMGSGTWAVVAVFFMLAIWLRKQCPPRPIRE